MLNILKLVGGYNLATGAFIWVVPSVFYDRVPGVAMTGPFNDHFLRDVALAYLVAGLAMAVAAARRDPVLALFAATWPAFHAVFHIWIWAVMRGGALDHVALANLFGIQVPAWAGVGAALYMLRRAPA